MRSWCNRAFDLVPRDTITVGTRVLPAFRSLGVAGFHVALLVAVLTGLRTGVSALDAVGLSAVAGISFFGWALLRRAVTGRESLVLFEHVWVAFAAVAAFLVATGASLLAGLDVLAVALCPFLAFGRIGCLVAGCCHGHPAGVGVRYPASAGLPARLSGVRLFPLPLVEALALPAIGVIAFALAGDGAATVWMLAAYAILRFGTESLRGDRRPALVGIPIARLMAGAQLAAAVALDEVRHGAVPTGPRPVITAAVLGASLLAGLVLTHRRRDPLGRAEHLDELWSRITAAAGAAPADGRLVLATTAQGVCVAASWTEAGLHVSFSHPSLCVDGLSSALGVVPIAPMQAAAHALVPAERLTPPQAQSTAEPASLPDRYFGTR